MKSIIRKTAAGLSLALALLAFSGCASSTKSAQMTRDGEVHELVVLHTNDHHGTVLAKDGKAGLAQRATFIKEQRAQNENVLLLDSGDINTGSAVSNMFNAEPDILAYNMMKYDASTFGNHEFDGSLAKLTKQMKISEFPWVNSNIRKGNKYLGIPYITKEFDDYRVGIFGLTTLRSLVIASPDASLTFADEVATAKEMVKVLKEKENCDIIILISHCGDILEAPDQNTSYVIAESVDGIDMIIDGHSHSYFETAKKVNSTYIVSANEWGKYVGKGVLSVQNGKLVNFAWKPEAITSDKYAENAEVKALIDPYVAKANESLKEVVMHTSDEFVFGKKLTRYQEMPLGDFVCDAMVSYVESTGVKVDGAIENGGGIRAHLPAGDVTREDIVTVLPFENYLYVLTLRGSDLKELFSFIGSVKQGAGAFAQVSRGIRYTITYDEEGNGSISDLTINGKKIDDNATYRIATNDYMAGGGDGYVAFKNAIDSYNSSMLLSDVVISYAQTLKGPAVPASDGRITVIGGNLPQ